MSDDSDSGPRHKRKRNTRYLIDSPSSASSSAASSIVTTSRRRPRRRHIEDDTDSDSGSSIEIHPKRKAIPRVASDDDSDSSGSVIIQRSKRPARVVSESSDSDHGFEGSSSSWETDLSDTESRACTSATATSKTAKVQDTGVDSDSSDGQSEKCPICLISFGTQEVGTPESCDHMFCVECIQEWSKNMNTCPVDRQEYHLILVRRNINGSIYKQIPVQTPTPQNDIDIVEDPTFCEVCGLCDREDRMLLCDGCDLGFHLECLNPPLSEIPTGAWFCSDCTPEDLVDPEIELFELQQLLDDAHDLDLVRSRGTRRNPTSRLVPRTQQNERVRRRIATNRSTNQPSSSPQQPVTSTTSRSRPKKKKKKKNRKRSYRVVYQFDENTGETVAIKKRIRRRKKKKSRRPLPTPKTVKKRLALQLGMCSRGVPQSVPDVKVLPQVSNLQHQRFQAGIPTLRLFGNPDELELWSEGEGNGTGVLVRRAVSHRRTLMKTVSVSSPVSSTTDVLDTILDVQARFHSKNTKFSIGKNGRLTMEPSQERVSTQMNNFNNLVRSAPASYSNDNRSDSVPTSSGQSNSSPDRNNSAPTSTITENSTTGANSTGSGDSHNNSQDYDPAAVYTHYDIDIEGLKKDKKLEDTSETNTTRSGTPASESEIDIYSDIETVSTSKADDGDFSRRPLPTPPLPPPSLLNDPSDDENDSETDMVIDTEKAVTEPEENIKEETAVTSTVGSNADVTPVPIIIPSSTSVIQSQAIQSSNVLFNDRNETKRQDEDEDSEDECPNFSIYSQESITMAKNTDITLGPSEEDPQETNQAGEASSLPVGEECPSPVRESEISSLPAAITEEIKAEANTEENVERPIKKLSMSTGLYSDSEDETVVKRGVENSFGITDLQNMTEDISEEERSYTPCLDERPNFRQGIEGLDTEMISDEERNDFDENHELKTASDGDALEINAKESELDFTRPEDYEEGEIVDKTKNKKTEEKRENEEEVVTKPVKKKEEADKTDNKENENQNNNKESTFKKISKNNKDRNYRDKDKERERSKSREKKDRDRKDRRREKRKEIERYDVRALIADKPRRMKDRFGRDIRRSGSRSRTRTPSPPKRSPSRGRRSGSRRSNSKRRSVSRRRSPSKERNRKKRRRSKARRSLSRSKSRSPDRRRSRSKTKKRKRSISRGRKKSRDRSKGKSKKQRSRSRHRSRSPTPKRAKEWGRRHSRDWSPSLSRSRSPEQRHLTPSWTPPRVMDNSVKPHNLTVILTNDAKKKKEKKKKNDKRTKESDRAKKRKRNDRTPPPSKEVFASGDNILVSVSFNKDNEVRDVSTKKKREEEANKKQRKEKVKKKKKRDLTGVKPVAIIDLERSPFKELTPSPKDVIVLSDSDNEESRNMQKTICDSSQQVASPERINSYTTGPKTPPEPQVKFTLTKQTQLRAISNPLHEPDDIEPEEGDTQEVADSMHKGPNTPPEPPNSPPSSPDAYDPFEPTKSRSPTPEPTQTTQSNSALNLDDNREDSIMEARTEIDKTNNSSIQPADVSKSLTPPLADVQPADSQSSIQATPESSLGKSPEHGASAAVQTQTVTASKPVAQTIPFSSSVPTSLMTSTPVSTTLAPPRINILNSTLITSPHVASSIPQRIVLPNIVKSSPVKISPTKATIKSTPIKPMPAKTQRKSTNRNQNGSDTVESNLGLDSPYSPGSSDYEDLFEPPVETAKPASKPATKNSKSPNKVQNAFDALFGSPFNKTKPKQDKSQNKFNKKAANTSGKGTKQVGVKLDEDNLKILDELPNSAVEMQVKDKFLKKLNRQERVVEEVKLVLKPHYNKKHVNKEEYKDILRRAVPKICHNKSGEINPTKIKNLIEAYVKKVRHSKKVTSSSNSVNPQKV